MIKLSLIKGKIIIMIKRSLIKGETGQEIIISAPHIKVGRVGCWGVRRQTLAGNILIRFSNIIEKDNILNCSIQVSKKS